MVKKCDKGDEYYSVDQIYPKHLSKSASLTVSDQLLPDVFLLKKNPLGNVPITPSIIFIWWSVYQCEVKDGKVGKTIFPHFNSKQNCLGPLEKHFSNDQRKQTEK